MSSTLSQGEASVLIAGHKLRRTNPAEAMHRRSGKPGGISAASG
jgi:hypothetical protein